MKKDKRMFKIVLSVISEYDPEGLMPGENAPANEYSPEAKPIADFFEANLEEAIKSPEILAEEINQVWMEMFGGRKCRHATAIARELARQFGDEEAA